MATNESGELFEFDARPVIKGYPELRWTGKRQAPSWDMTGHGCTNCANLLFG